MKMIFTSNIHNKMETKEIKADLDKMKREFDLRRKCELIYKIREYQVINPSVTNLYFDNSLLSMDTPLNVLEDMYNFYLEDIKIKREHKKNIGLKNNILYFIKMKDNLNDNLESDKKFDFDFDEDFELNDNSVKNDVTLKLLNKLMLIENIKVYYYSTTFFGSFFMLLACLVSPKKYFSEFKKTLDDYNNDKLSIHIKKLIDNIDISKLNYYELKSLEMSVITTNIVMDEINA